MVEEKVTGSRRTDKRGDVCTEEKTPSRQQEKTYCCSVVALRDCSCNSRKQTD